MPEGHDEKGRFTEGNPYGRPLIFKTPEDLEQRIEAYWLECAERGVPETMAGLAYALEIDRKTLLNYGDRAPFFRAVTRARERVERAHEELLFNKETARGASFSLQNNFDWTEKTAATVLLTPQYVDRTDADA